MGVADACGAANPTRSRNPAGIVAWKRDEGALGCWASACHRWRRWCVRGWWGLVFEALHPSLSADSRKRFAFAAGLVLLDGTPCKARRAASGAARSTAAAEALGRSRGGLCSRPHVCADGAGRIFRLIASPGQHSDLRHAAALASGIPACDAAFGRGYVSAKLRAAFAADGRTIHTLPKKGMVDPPAWTPALCARRHHVEDLFSRMKDWARIALRRDKTRQSRMGFAHLAAIMINSRAAEFSHRA